MTNINQNGIEKILTIKTKGVLKMKVLKTIFFSVIYMIIYYFFQFFFVYLGLFIVGIINITHNYRLNSQKMIGNIFITGVIISAIISFFIYWGITSLRKQKIFEICNFKKVKLQYLIVALIMGISINIINEYLLTQMIKIEIFKEAFQRFMFLAEMMRNTNIIISILGIGIIGPVIEEIIFRGLLFDELKKVMPVSLVIIIQGVAFGIYHFNIIQFIYATLIGLLLGVVYALTKNIWPMIIIHIVNNICALFIPENHKIISPIFVILFIILTILCLIYFYKKRETRMPENDDPFILV